MAGTRSLGAIASGTALAVCITALVSLSSRGQAPDVATLDKLFADGNFKDAYGGFRKQCLNVDTPHGRVADALGKAIQCLQRFQRIKEADELIESTVKSHKMDWHVLAAAAHEYRSLNGHGFMIAGKFERGPHRGGGQYAHATERDRARALQLMLEAMPLAQQDDNKSEVGHFYMMIAEMLQRNRHGAQAWQLQSLTDLDELPDYQVGYYNATPQGAPVNENGDPVFYQVPDSWEDAKSDGERWRWSFAQAVENVPGHEDNVRWQMADFWWRQLGVQSMQQFFLPFSSSDEDAESGTYALHTLNDKETISRLATGIRRFELPDEFNFIKSFEELANKPRGGYEELAANRLAELYENRRQYPRAAEWWRTSLTRNGRASWKQQRLDQIVKNWGRFEGVSTQPAREGASVEFLFRNASEVSFDAQQINVEMLLGDVKRYLKSNPGQLNYQNFNIENLGWRIVQNNQKKYLGKQIASWTEKLQPRPGHFDKRITVTTPLKTAGAYLVTARVKDGNTSNIVLWVADTAIVQKQLAEKPYYFVADAVTGKPIAGANVEFFGYRRERINDRNKYRVITTNFADKTGPNGKLVPRDMEVDKGYQWLTVARTKDGRLAHLGFRNVWRSGYHDAQYNEVKAFGITDRPVYRPGHEVKFKFWLRHAQYDKDNESQFAGQQLSVRLHSPQGDVVQSWSLKADEYGGIEGTFELPTDATLGSYSLHVVNYHAVTFRVEEYKKPEFEVTIEAPERPVQLGEKITAKIEAKYYFGAPVVNATVKYKILRTKHSQNWYPVRAWDWCYGPGYWWYGYDYPWYPGWYKWVGCMRPLPWWWHGGHDPPEVIAEREVEIGEEGIVEVEIDTALAKEMHGDSDHKYSITAEVRDESRRTIVGQGNVLVARQPYKIFTWVDRGYYRVGDTIHANFLAQALDNRAVKASGSVKLYQIAYDDNGEPEEFEVGRWKVGTDDEGAADLHLAAHTNGQYRISCELIDAEGHKVEGGYLLTVMGNGFDGGDYRFNNIELIPDKAEYQLGETVKLQINTDRIGSSVLLFVRPSNGVYLPPKLVRLRGKSTVEEIVIVKRDMPNFFVEAVTVADGRVHSDAKEIVVPPEERVLNVAVVPDSVSYKPGEKAKVTLHVTEANGENFAGTTAVSIYDKSLEYISGGSNVADIKEFFWKWRRQHQPTQFTSLDRFTRNQPLPNKQQMGFVGVFGSTVAEELKGLSVFAKDGKMQVRRDGLRQGMLLNDDFEFDRLAVAEGMSMASQSMAEGPSVSIGLDVDFDIADAAPLEQTLVEPTVRTNFADSALWVGTLDTDDEGHAEVALEMPENLTTWKVKVWGMGHGTKVGSGEAEVITRKDLIVRLQAPRFFVQKDEVVLSANVHNYLASDKQVTVSLELPADELEPMNALVTQVTVPANGEQRVDWRVRVLREGMATIRMQALTDEESDAVEMKLPCHVHGMLKTDSWAGTVRPEDESATVTINVPAERRVEDSRLEIRYSPTLATAMVDALPYLADYPYGCTEQTLNRFLPTVITQKTLLEMNLDLEAIGAKRTNLNAQEIGDDRQRSLQWQRFDRNPVFDQAELDMMVREGVKRLTNMQLTDGGWGWFSGWGEHSYPHTTAVVVHGLQVAEQNDVAIVPDVIDNGITWLKKYQAAELQKLKNAKREIKPWKNHADNVDAFVYMILVDAGQDSVEMRDFLYRDRNDLAVYSKAMFGLALHRLEDNEKLQMITRNIEQYLVQDEENETAYLRMPEGGYWWYWYGDETEANAYYLKLLSRINPEGETAPRLVKYLLNNRKHSTYWRSTRDTALCVEAFADYIRASGEAQPDMTVELLVDGEKQKEIRITGENLFTFDNKFVLSGKEVTDGEHVIEIRRRGNGPVYFNAYLTNFTLEDHITRAGLEVKVDRRYYKLVEDDKVAEMAGARGQVLKQRIDKYKREPIENLDMLKSGDLVEVELVIESKNDYEYLIFEDMKAAGFETVDVRSGYTNNALGAYAEFRDDRVSFFVRRLARGRHSISYRLRAEIPGRFSALPALAYAMYAPELKGNSDEIKLQIED
ncbi:MAG: alpha-2-macroglobulin [Planctomycetaceae bacterium]|nr:alpha-2-macroglobulin [Planctomycetaceae bacterium]